MKKFLIVALMTSVIGCSEYRQPDTTLSSYYLIDTINSIHNAIVAEIDSVMYVVPNYTTVDFNNKDSVLNLHNVIRYCRRVEESYAHYDKEDPRLDKLKCLNSPIEDELILEYYTTINEIKLYNFVFVPQNYLLILQTKKVNIIYYVESDGYVSDAIDCDGFIKEYVPVLLPLFSKKDLVEIDKRFSELIDSYNN